jgi:protein-tyrosine phosphatase
MTLTTGGRQYFVLGGPFADRPPGLLHVCLLVFPPKLKEPVVCIPIPDYGCPERADVLACMPALLRVLADEKVIYVGCLGGFGRTGLMLALIAKVWGIKNPLEYVRHCYHPRAVETLRQEEYIKSFRVPLWLKLYVFWKKISIRFG